MRIKDLWPKSRTRPRSRAFQRAAAALGRPGSFSKGNTPQAARPRPRRALGIDLTAGAQKTPAV